MYAMHIDWAALGAVFGVSLVVTVGLVCLFALGVAGLTRAEAAAADGRGRAVPVTFGYLCFAVCVAAVGYGIWLLVA